MKKNKILVFGEILWDVFENERFLGGAPLNFAAHCVRCGADSRLISGIGKDELGIETAEKIANYGVGCDLIQNKDLFPTGVTVVTVKNGEPTYELKKNTAYDNIEYSLEFQKKIDDYSADCFYFGTVGRRSEVSADTLRKILKNSKFPHIFCDLNLRPESYTEETVEFCLREANILKINREEIGIIKKSGFVDCKTDSLEDFAVDLTNKFPNLKLLIITLDCDGAYIYDKENNKSLGFPAPKCKIVSATGAGDAFCAAFITSCLKGNSLEECTKKATELAGYVLSFTEAIPD